MDFESTLSNTAQHRVVSESIPWSQPGSLSVVACSDERHITALGEPENKLMFAVLEDAIECFQENHSAHYGQRRRAFMDAQRWIFGAHSDWVFGFENICSVLGFDPEYIRKGLARWGETEALKPRQPRRRADGLCAVQRAKTANPRLGETSVSLAP